MDRILVFLLSLSIFLSPYYLFDSGLPQINDMIAALAIVVFFVSGKFNKIGKHKTLRPLLWLVILIAFINLTYHFKFLTENLDTRMYISPFFYLYNALFYALALYVLSLDFYKYSNLLSWVLMVTLFSQVLIGFFGVGGSSRGVLFFNNPNQLGYFSLLTLSCFVILPSKYRSNLFFLLLMILSSSYLILLSGSRAALVGVLLLGVIAYLKEGIKLSAKAIFLAVVIIPSLFLLIGNSRFFESKLESISQRQERSMHSNVAEYKIRGYDRFLLHPEYVLYGAGEGNYARLKSYHSLEMHSGWGTMLFSYGIIGLFLFVSFLRLNFKFATKSSILVFLPALLYNLTHQGLRDSLFWLLIGFIYMSSLQKALPKLDSEKS